MIRVFLMMQIICRLQTTEPQVESFAMQDSLIDVDVNYIAFKYQFETSSAFYFDTTGTMFAEDSAGEFKISLCDSVLDKRFREVLKNIWRQQGYEITP